MPNSAFSWPPFGSILNQDLDPPTPKASLALEEQRPSACKYEVSRKLIKYKYNKNKKEDNKFGVERSG